MRAEVWQRLVSVGAAPLLTALVVSTSVAQERTVVAKQVSVGSSEAALHLELSSGAPVDVSVEDGDVRVAGETIGEATPELVEAWRSLLAVAIPLDDAPLLRALRDWDAPELEGEAGKVARAVDAYLEEALARVAVEDVEPSEDIVRSLLSRKDRLARLTRAVQGVDLDLDQLSVHVGEDVSIPEFVEMDASLVIIGADLDVRGEVNGDVVLVDGVARLFPGSRVRGDLRLSDARLENDGGELEGELIEIHLDAAAEAPASTSEVIRHQIRDQIRNELRAELRSELRNAGRSGRGGLFAPLRHVGRGAAGIVSNFITVLVLGVIGFVFLAFSRGNLDVIAEAARRTPGRAAVVGVAGTFLAFPVWILGVVALAITLIGAPLIVLWLPLYPLAIGIGAMLGFYAVANNLGLWVARQRAPYLRWVRASNRATLLLGGLLVLMSSFMFANVAEMGGPWLGFLEGLLATVGVLAIVGATLIGFGAVLMTRGGRVPQYYPDAHDEPLDL